MIWEIVHIFCSQFRSQIFTNIACKNCAVRWPQGKFPQKVKISILGMDSIQDSAFFNISLHFFHKFSNNFFVIDSRKNFFTNWWRSDSILIGKQRVVFFNVCSYKFHDAPATLQGLRWLAGSVDWRADLARAGDCFHVVVAAGFNARIWIARAKHHWNFGAPRMDAHRVMGFFKREFPIWYFLGVASAPTCIYWNRVGAGVSFSVRFCWCKMVAIIFSENISANLRVTW